MILTHSAGFRGGELAVSLWTDLKIMPYKDSMTGKDMNLFLLHLDSTKTDKSNQGTVVSISCPVKRSSFNVCTIMLKYIKLLKKKGISSKYIFPTLRKCDKGLKHISTATIRTQNQIKYHLATGRPGNEVGAHSGRRGFVTDAIAAGVPVELIKKTGRWQSDCWRIYYHDEQFAQIQATSMLYEFGQDKIGNDEKW